MDFLLYNNTFTKIILCLMFFNFIIKILINIYNFFKSEKKLSDLFFDQELNNENKNHFIEDDKFSLFVYRFIIITFLLFFIIIGLNSKLNILIGITVVFIAFIYTINDIFKKKYDVEYNVYPYIYSCLLIIFFNSEIINELLIQINNLPYYFKDIIILFIINIKLMSFIFFLLINLSVFMNYLNKALRLLSVKLERNFKNENIFKIKYSFNLHKEHDTLFYLIFDCIIFIILFPILILLFGLKYLHLYLSSFILRLIDNFNKTYYNNTLVFIKLIKISVIFTLTAINIMIFYSDGYSQSLSESYNFISTVILIPLIYEQIK